MTQKHTHGGARRNAGAKPKYFEKTKTISVQCPISKIPELKEVIQEKLDSWKINSKDCIRNQKK